MGTYSYYADPKIDEEIKEWVPPHEREDLTKDLKLGEIPGDSPEKIQRYKDARSRSALNDLIKTRKHFLEKVKTENLPTESYKPSRFESAVQGAGDVLIKGISAFKSPETKVEPTTPPKTIVEASMDKAKGVPLPDEFEAQPRISVKKAVVPKNTSPAIYSYDYPDMPPDEIGPPKIESSADMFKEVTERSKARPVEKEVYTPSELIGKEKSKKVDSIYDVITKGNREGFSFLWDSIAKGSDLLDRAADKISEKTGMEKGEAFKKLKTYSEKRLKEIEVKPEEMQDIDTFTEKVLFGLGAAPGVIATYAGPQKAVGPIAAFALVDAVKESDKGAMESLKAGIKGAITGTVLKATEPLTRGLRAATVGGLFAGEKALEGGDISDIASAGTVGAILSQMSPGGKIGPKEAAEYVKDSVMYKNVTKTIPAEDIAEAFRGRESSKEAKDFVTGLSPEEKVEIAKGALKGKGARFKVREPRFGAKPDEIVTPPEPVRPTTQGMPATEKAASPPLPEDIERIPPARLGTKVKEEAVRASGLVPSELEIAGPRQFLVKKDRGITPEEAITKEDIAEIVGGVLPEKEIASQEVVQAPITQTEIKPPIERRTDLERRKRIDEMTQEELKTELLTSPIAGIPNNRAYDEAEKKPVQVMSDIDGLKWINDNFGHEAGDKLIRAKAETLKSLGIEGYHLGGDEFVSQFDSIKQARESMSALNNKLSNDIIIEATLPDGSTRQFKGWGFSYGIGQDKQGADTELRSSKTEREREGTRASRGERPPGLSEITPEGIKDNLSQVPTPEEGLTSQPANVPSPEPEVIPESKPIQSYKDQINEQYPDLTDEDIKYAANLTADTFEDMSKKLKGKKAGAVRSTSLAWRRYAKTGVEQGPKGGINAFEFGKEEFEKQLASYLKSKNKPEEIVVGDLPPDAKFKIKGEDFRVSDYDSETGEITIKDGQTYKLDSFDKIAVDGGMEGVSKPVKTTFPSLIDFAKSKLSPEIAEQITSESQVQSFRPQWEKEKAAIPANKTTIPKELEPLAEEARKYKSVDEWKQSISEEPRGKTPLGEAVLGPLSLKGSLVTQYGFKNLNDFYNQATKNNAKPFALIPDELSPPSKPKAPEPQAEMFKGSETMQAGAKPLIGEEPSEFFKKPEQGVQTEINEPTPDYGNEEKKPVFYSRLRRTVEQSPQGKGSGAQWKSFIKNSKLGANADEMGLVGVGDLEDSNTYTKQEVLDYLKANEVVVKDVTLGRGQPVFKQGFSTQDELIDAFESDPMLIDRGGELKSHLEIIKQDGLWNLLDHASSGDTSHFSDFQLPGSEEGSYHEVLLTMPERIKNVEWKDSGPIDLNLEMRGGGYSVMPSRRWIANINGADYDITWNPNKSQFILNGERGGLQNAHFHTLDQAKEYALKGTQYEASGRNIWRDGHSQYNNIVNPIVRLRFNKRETTDGKSMMFLEEVQPPSANNQKKMPALFVKNWREIAFKWALRHAAENGFDSVGWTTGKIQAERYDLSKQINYMHVVRLGDSYTIWGSRPGRTGESELLQQRVTPDKLENWIGKDLAKKVIGNNDGKAEQRYSFSGLDLKIGGEGLKKLYDQDFRNAVNNLPVVKKSGQKVGEEEIKVGSRPVFTDSISLDEIKQKVEHFRTQWYSPSGWSNWNVSLDNAATDVIEAMEKGQSYSDAMYQHGMPSLSDALGGHTKWQPILANIHAIRITPAIRESVMAGQAIAAPKPDYDIIKANEEAKQEIEKIGKEPTGNISSAAGTLVVSKSGVRMLADALKRDFKENGRVDLRGQKISSIDDLVDLAQVFRNPKFETLRYIYINHETGEILAHEGVTSRLPATTSVIIGPRKKIVTITEDYKAGKISDKEAKKQISDAMSENIYDIKDRISRIKKTSGAKHIDVYLLHNHPSGEPNPSVEDRAVTEVLSGAIPEIRGHLVIDHKKYAYIDARGRSTMQYVPAFVEPDPILDPEIPHSLLGQIIKQPSDVARLGKEIVGANSSEIVVVFYRDSKGKIRGIQEVPFSMMQNEKAITEWVRGQGKAFGAYDVFAYYQGSGIQSQLTAEIKWEPYIKKGLFADIVYHGQGMVQNVIKEPNAGLYGTQIKTPTRVMEERPLYGVSSEDGKFHSSDSDVDSRIQTAKKGIRPPSISDWFSEKMTTLWHDISREFKDLPDTAEFSPLRTQLLKLQKAKMIETDKTLRNLADVVDGLSKEQYDLFEWKVLLSDLQKEAESGRDLPFGYTKEKVGRDLSEVDRLTGLNPGVQRAWEKRQAYWEDLKDRYKNSMDDIGFDVAAKITKEDYFRHQVLAYAQAQRLAGTGKELKTPTGRGFLKKREGSELDINANYLQAEFEVMAQMASDIHTAQTIALVDKKHNIRDQLKAEAKRANDEALAKKAAGDETIEDALTAYRQKIAMHMHNLHNALDLPADRSLTMNEVSDIAGDLQSPGNTHARGVLKNISERQRFARGQLGDRYKTWRNMIPEGYEPWQPREGRILYLADSIPAQMAQQLQEGMLESVGLSAENLRKVLAMGGLREEYVVPNEVAATLNQLKRHEPDIIRDSLRQVMGHIKSLWLLSPRRSIRYNVRNLSGDAEGTFVGNPHAFAKAQRAMSDLWPVFMGEKKLTGEVAQWFDRGGVGSTLQFQEMGDLADLKAFKSAIEKEAKGGWASAPFLIWNKYWKSMRLATDYRESILRYANYLDYLEQMQSSKVGKPKNYGASIRETVDALPDIRDRAYKISNELLGAYDRVSVAGHNLRDFWYPFWSWQEVNFRRYAGLVRNAVEDADFGSIGRGGIAAGVGTATRMASFLIKFSAFWATLQIANNLLFPDEEQEFAETNPVQANRPHIIFGRDEEGKILYFSGLGALGDLLSWFGLDTFPNEVGDLMHGRLTLKEVIENIWQAPFNKIWSGITPYVKMPVELLSKQTFYPDVFHPRPIQNRDEYLMRELTLEPEYRVLKGKPGPDYLGAEDVTGLLVQRTDPDASAYWTWQGIEDKLLVRMGKDQKPIFWRTPKGEALKNITSSIRYKDKEKEEKYRKEYKDLGGTDKDMEKSLMAQAPLKGMSKKERDEALKQLGNEDKRILARAEKYYKTVILAPLSDGRRRSVIGRLKSKKWLSSEGESSLAPHELSGEGPMSDESLIP